MIVPKLVLVCFLLFSITIGFAQSSILMEKQSGINMIPCNVNGLPLKFIFDTGASNVAISATEALFMLKNGYLDSDDISKTEYYMLANGEVIEGTTINLRQIEIGNVKIENIEATIVHQLEAPLLLGQSAISELGKYSIEGEYLLLNMGAESKNYLDYSKIEVNTANLNAIFFNSLGKNYQSEQSLTRCVKEIDSLKFEAFKGNGEASYNLGVNMTNIAGEFERIIEYVKKRDISSKEYLILERLYDENIFWTKKAVNLNYKKANKRMGSIYYSNEKNIFSNNYELAIDYYRVAFEKYGCNECTRYISDAYGKLNNSEKAFTWALKAANLGFSKMGLRKTMGDYYFNGVGIKKDLNEALRWYLKDDEFLKIAEMYYFGEGIQRNDKEASNYFLKALNKEISNLKMRCQCDNYRDIVIENYTAGWATYRLASMYYEGNFFEKNYRTAAAYLKESANVFNNNHAKSFLGDLYLKGHGVLKDEKQGFRLFEMSALEGVGSGQYNLGRCYLYGNGTNIDKAKAAFWIKKAYDNGIDQAEIIWNKYELWNYLD